MRNSAMALRGLKAYIQYLREDPPVHVGTAHVEVPAIDHPQFSMQHSAPEPPAEVEAPNLHALCKGNTEILVTLTQNT